VYREAPDQEPPGGLARFFPPGDDIDKIENRGDEVKQESDFEEQEVKVHVISFGR
jgi:hypothetical protein